MLSDLRCNMLCPATHPPHLRQGDSTTVIDALLLSQSLYCVLAPPPTPIHTHPPTHPPTLPPTLLQGDSTKVIDALLLNQLLCCVPSTPPPPSPPHSTPPPTNQHPPG
jgi:hypothetical protein